MSSDRIDSNNDTANGPVSVSEAELHAWVDGQLSNDRVAAVTDWLLRHPDDAVRVQAWKQQRLAFQSLHRDLLDAPVPIALARAVKPRWSGMEKLAAQAVAALLLLAVGFGSGWWLHARPNESGIANSALPQFVREAAVAYAVYSPEKRHPVEVTADQQAHLVQWLSRRVGADLKAPVLAADGFELMGGRLLPGEKGEARAQFMYENARGSRVTLHVASLVESQSHETGAFSFVTTGKTQNFYWVDGKLGYALSGEVPKSVLAQLAQTSYAQLAK